MNDSKQSIRPPAEELYATELAVLKATDEHPVPPGWNMSPAAVKAFITGTEGQKLSCSLNEEKVELAISRKFYGDDILVERCIVTLLGNRGLMLVGDPGTAKSMLSELLTAAISGDSQLTIQGTAGTTEDQIKYSWNYALLLAEGPSEKSIVPGPVFNGLRDGKIVRFEEITRCQPEIQDALVSVLSDKCLHIAELEGDLSVLSAQRGFNVIATANLQDRGVNEMSSALKRRFNFETVHPIADRDMEMALVREQTEKLLSECSVEMKYSEDALELLITTFQDLRHGKTAEGASVEKPSTVMSTAEAVSVSLSACLDAHYFGKGRIDGSHITRQLVGTVFKDDPNDAKKLKHYLNVVAKARSKRGGVWSEFYKSRDLLR